MVDNTTEPTSRPRKTSVNLGSCLFGIPIKLHFSFFILLGLEMVFSILEENAAWTTFIFLLYGPFLLTTIIIHELGHALATLKQGGEVDGIVLWPLGGFALCGPTDKGAKGDFLVAIAGPLTHVFQSAAWLGLYFTTGHGLSNFNFSLKLDDLKSFEGFFSQFCEQAILFNISLFVFNLLIPAYPLDGGRCLASLLMMCGVRLDLAAYITAITSMVIASLFLLYGIIGLLFAADPSSLLLIIIAAFIFMEGKKLHDLTKDGRVKEHPIFGRGCYDDRESNINVTDDTTVATANDEIETARVV